MLGQKGKFLLVCASFLYAAHIAEYVNFMHASIRIMCNVHVYLYIQSIYMHDVRLY